MAPSGVEDFLFKIYLEQIYFIYSQVILETIITI